jgi:hypothetical protein
VKEAAPDIFVVANDLGLTATFARICRLQRIPTLSIQDGLLSTGEWKSLLGKLLACKRYLPWRLISTITNTPAISKLTLQLGLLWEIPVWGAGGTSVIAVMGDYYKNVLASKGVNPNKIVITGYPLFDNVCNYIPTFTRKQFCDQMSLNPNAPLVLFISQPFIEDGFWTAELKESLVEFIAKGVKQVNGQLVVKLHPRENQDFFKKLVDDHPELNFVLLKNFGLDDLLFLSDSVITVSSTVGLWTVAHGKKLLVLNGYYTPSKNIIEDIGIPVQNLPELVNQLKQQNESDLTKKNISEHIYKLDGKASERIAKLIIHIVNTNQKERK